MERIRVYHPETDESFELPSAQATELILKEGWRQQPLFENKPAPVVEEVVIEEHFEEHFEEVQETEVEETTEDSVEQDDPSNPFQRRSR